MCFSHHRAKCVGWASAMISSGCLSSNRETVKSAEIRGLKVNQKESEGKRDGKLSKWHRSNLGTHRPVKICCIFVAKIKKVEPTWRTCFRTNYWERHQEGFEPTSYWLEAFALPLRYNHNFTLFSEKPPSVWPRRLLRLPRAAQEVLSRWIRWTWVFF